MKYVITGGAGFIGSHIAEELAKQGEEVVIIDNLFSGTIENFAHFKDKVTFLKGDICDADFVMKALEGADYVLHQAARRSVPHSLDAPIEYNETNINGTVNLLEAAKKHKVKRFVFASSSSVYGNDATLPLTEGGETDQISPYALTKLVGEKYLKMYYDLYGLPTVSLRYFNVFGPRQDPDSQYSAVIPLFIKAIANGKQPTIFGDGEQTRDFTYIANIVEGNLKACTSEKAIGQIINVANGDQISVNKLLKDLNEIMGKDIKAIHTDVRAGDVKHTNANNKRAIELLDYKGNVSFIEGLKKTVEWFEETF